MLAAPSTPHRTGTSTLEGDMGARYGTATALTSLLTNGPTFLLARSLYQSARGIEIVVGHSCTIRVDGFSIGGVSLGRRVIIIVVQALLRFSKRLLRFALELFTFPFELLAQVACQLGRGPAHSAFGFFSNTFRSILSALIMHVVHVSPQS
jgi:hypothetical protein